MHYIIFTKLPNLCTSLEVKKIASLANHIWGQQKGNYPLVLCGVDFKMDCLVGINNRLG